MLVDMNQPVTPEAVAAEVRAEMGRQRKTRQGLAREIHVTPVTAARRLDGSIPFDVVELDLTARWLGTTAATLIERAVASATTAEVA